MVSLVCEYRGRLIRTVDKRVIVAVPKGVGVDTQFPFNLKIGSSTPVKISIDTKGKKLVVEKWTE